MTLAVVILAAGQGTRMQSKKQKILHDVGGKPMVQHVFEAATAVADLPPVIVVGPGEDGVSNLLGNQAIYVVQPEQLGTGHATKMAEAVTQGKADQVIVTYGDMPLLRASTLQQLAATQNESGATVTMLSLLGELESSFGRVVRDEVGRVIEIVEVAEARQRPNTAELLAIRELNAGVYCFAAAWLWRNIDKLPLRQARSGQEYYLTDMIGLAVEEGQLVMALTIDDADECLGAGTRQELVAVEKAFRRRAARHWMANGVTLIDPDTIYIDQDVAIGQDTIIWPNTYIQGNTIIGDDCILGPNTMIRNAHIGSTCRIEQAMIENGSVASGTRIEPFTQMINSDWPPAAG
ncbi:MAG: NTP transferase domain-containing protein [Chloroflexi bacterium]|jgi:bifunctional UDP-N-acetylglucosamine pyrophosphorylase/glucosamine-1-phosphate N-acetyltransferase|nr:NTP transferase domain-containing protein [Chloroflexota bacterium]